MDVNNVARKKERRYGQRRRERDGRMALALECCGQITQCLVACYARYLHHNIPPPPYPFSSDPRFKISRGREREKERIEEEGGGLTS